MHPQDLRQGETEKKEAQSGADTEDSIQHGDSFGQRGTNSKLHQIQVRDISRGH